ncbi:unnamed protein product [Linum tenue]|uniref:Uncharacterized protein n=1 Tax=Linum tenue TaxID=586396 RepID=A0AAV0P7G4_9ROSI|nr:unnamed protein product [Linum tenue]
MKVLSSKEDIGVFRNNKQKMTVSVGFQLTKEVDLLVCTVLDLVVQGAEGDCKWELWWL